MGQITDLAKAVFANGPASAPYEPPKEDIRTLFGVIDTNLSNLINGLVIGGAVFYATRAALFADLSKNNGTLGVVYNDPTPAYNGVYVKSFGPGSGSWTLTGLALPGTILADLAKVITDLAAEVAARKALSAKVPDLARQKGVRDFRATGLQIPNPRAPIVYEPQTFLAWSINTVPPGRDVQNPASLMLWLKTSAQAASWSLRVVERPVGIGNGNGAAIVDPGEHAQDVVLQDWTPRVALDVMSDPARFGAVQAARFALSPTIGPYRDGFIQMHQIRAFDANGAVVNIGPARAQNAQNTTIDPLWLRGWFAFAVDGPYSAPDDGGMIAWSLNEANYTDAAPGTDSEMTVKLNGPLTQVQTGTSIVLPNYTVDHQPAPVGVERGANPTVDIASLQAGQKAYHTLISLTETAQLVPILGAARTVDPNNYIASTATSSVKGFAQVVNVLVNGSTKEIIRTSDFDGFIKRGEEGRHMAWLEYNRKRLANFFRLLSSGAPVRWMSYGDSIRSISAPGAPPDPLTPNGPNRDVIGYLEGFPSDTLAAIPRYDGDGGAGAHVRFGSEWVIKAAIEARWGSLVEYLNMSVPGTDSSNTGSNGLATARLNAARALKADLVHIPFGKNEEASTATFQNVYDLIMSHRANGSTVLVSTPTRSNRDGGFNSTDAWLFTCREIIRAARAADAAYVDYTRICGPGNEGAMGISAATMSGANRINHPDHYELQKYGEYASLIFA